MKFVSKELALKLNEKGFDKPCFGYYYLETPTGFTDDELVLSRYYGRGGTFVDTLKRHDLPYTTSNIVDAPTIDQTLEWLRGKDIYIWIEPYNAFTTENHLAFLWNITLGKSFKSKEQLFDKDTFYTHIHLDIEHWEINYDDAYIAGIKYVVDNLI